ncbi:MAG: TonB-dependent receptor [Pseudomonadota bacterium]
MAAKLAILCSASLMTMVALTAPAAAQDAPLPVTPVQEEDIVVTGIRGSLQSAQARKEAAVAVTDSIDAEDMGKLPDNTVSDALQRVTGIQVQRANGEATTVLIRGLPNVTSYINGRETFTGTGRGVALQDIPAELVAGVDVYKTATPDLVEGGVAGRIDIRMRRPFDLKTGITVAGSARALYSDKREKWSYIASGLISGHWETAGGQEFGLLVGASYNNRKYRDQTAFNFGFNPFSGPATGEIPAVPPSPGNPAGTPAVPNYVLIPDTVGGLVTDGDRIRPAINASLQWKPSPDFEIYLDGLFTGYRQDYDVNFFVGLPKAGNVTVVTRQAGTVNIGATSYPVANTITTLDNFTITSKQTFHQKTDGYQFAGGFKWTGDHTLLSSELSYNDSRVASTSYIVDANFVVPRIDYSFNNGGTPQISAKTAGGAAYDLTNTANLNLFALFDQRSLATSRQVAWRGDFRYNFDGSVLTNFQIGVRSARRVGSSDGTGENRFGLAGAGTSYPGFGVGGPELLDGIVGVDGFALPSTSFIRANIDQLRAIAGRPAGAPAFAPTLAFDLVEDNYAFYGQAGFDFSESGVPLEGVLGARVVNNVTNLDATLINNGVPSPTSGHRNELNFLPSLTLKLRPADGIVLRLVAGESITAPEFAQLNPATNLAPLGATGNSSTFGAGSGGNPNLESIKTRNLDGTIEWYFSRTGSITLSAFYRKLDGYIQTYSAVEFFPTGAGGALQSYAISRPRNTNKGTLKGFEAAYQHFFDFLPGPLSGFGVQANFTYAVGEVEAPGSTGVMQPITPVSKYSYNLVAMYEKYGFTARLAYNWRSKFVDFYDANIPGGFNEAQPIAFLDFSASYDLTPNVTVAVDATNLLNTTYHDYFGGYRIAPRDTRQYDRTFSAGVRFRF